MVLIRHLYKSEFWFCVGSKNENRTKFLLNKIGLHSEHVVTILDSVVNMIGKTYIDI